MRKAFILDTNVLLFDPQALFKFGNNDIVIPIVVLEEIDRFKREMSENGRHARMFSRLLDDMRKDGELSKGVRLPNGGILTVELGGGNPLPMELPMEKADNRMLALAISIKKDQPKRPVVFVTKDVNLRIKADALGISSEDYEPESVEPELRKSEEGLKRLDEPTLKLTGTLFDMLITKGMSKVVEELESGKQTDETK